MRVIYHEKEDGRRKACAPLAMSKVLALNFDTVQNFLVRNNYRKNNKSGTYTHRFTNYGDFTICIDGFYYTFKRYLHHARTVNQFHNSNVDGRFIIATRGHWLAQVKGIIYDTQDSAMKRIKYIWKLTN